MKLQISHEFELEFEDKSYTGEFLDLTKKEKKQSKQMFEKQSKIATDLNNQIKKVAKLSRKIEIAEKQENWDNVEKHEKEKDAVEIRVNELSDNLDEISNLEEVYKRRLEVSLKSEDKDEILDLGELYGYERLHNVIAEDIAEKKEGK